MDNLQKKIEELQDRFIKLKDQLGISEREREANNLQHEMSVCGFWSDRDKAMEKSQRLGRLTSELQEWEEIGNDIKVLLSSPNLGDEYIENKLQELDKKVKDLEFTALFSGEYDRNNAIITIHSGTGGVDAQDWTEMLERMYLRYAEKKGWKAEILDRTLGNEAGIKNTTIMITGLWAYAYLKSENGVHRLLRNSPFNAEHLRQTSFALVEVLPEIKDEEVELNDSDLKIDVFKSSGPGGQGVNTTDSAVRITHLPTGLVVTCQNERSQHQNKANAIKILKSKLYQLALEDREGEERKLKGELKKAEWGQQIRSYFLYGNQLVKDHRTNYETNDVNSVLDGNIDEFIISYLNYIHKS